MQKRNTESSDKLDELQQSSSPISTWQSEKRTFGGDKDTRFIKFRVSVRVLWGDDAKTGLDVPELLRRNACQG